MSFILLRANRDLRDIGRALGHDTSEIETWISYLEEGVSLLWNSELCSYDSFDILTGNYTGSISNASFMCWYGGIYDKRMLQSDFTFDSNLYTNYNLTRLQDNE